MNILPGMTVQTRDRGHVAFCVRCWWESPQTSFQNAKRMACDAHSHVCTRVGD